MDAIQEDVAYLNSQVLLLATDSSKGRRFLHTLGAHPLVIKRIQAAQSKAIRTAIHCGVPLVSFSAGLERLLVSQSPDLHVSSLPDGAETVGELTRTALQVAQRVTSIDRTVARLYFGLTAVAGESLSSLSLTRLMQIADRQEVVLRLRAPQRETLWERLLIGDRCNGAPTGFRISRQAALLSLGNEL